MISLNKNRRKPQDRRGTALVEMALVLPIFFAVVLGIVEFGRAMMVSQLVTNAAREGARIAVLDDSSNAEVTQFIKDFLEDSINASPDDVTVTITVTAAPGNPNPGNEVGNAEQRDQCTIRVEIPFNKVNYVPGKYLDGKKLVGESSMRHE